MRKLSFTLMSLLAIGALCSQAQATVDTISGKNSTFFAASGEPCVAGQNIDLSGSIQKGKKKRVLTIDLTAQVDSSPASNNSLKGFLFVNGFADIVKASSFFTDNNGDCSLCETTGHFFVDLDAAEALHPGMFIGQPLTLSGQVQNQSSTSGTTCDVTLTARMEVK